MKKYLISFTVYYVHKPTEGSCWPMLRKKMLSNTNEKANKSLVNRYKNSSNSLRLYLFLDKKGLWEKPVNYISNRKKTSIPFQDASWIFFVKYIGVN